MKKKNDIRLFADPNELVHFAAKDFSQRAVEGVNAKKLFSVVLAGGNTPKLFFDRLTTPNTSAIIPWQHIHFFFGDERYVPPNDINNNYYMAYQHLFAKVPVNPDNIYPMPTDFEKPEQAAKQYEEILREKFQLKDNGLPEFDLVYLGLGADAHTASLMPLTNVIRETIDHPLSNNPLVSSLFVNKFNQYRLTLTPPAINNASNIVFMVTGADKASAVYEVLEGETDPLHYPAQLIHSTHGKTFWLLDQEAAQKLTLPKDKTGD